MRAVGESEQVGQVQALRVASGLGYLALVLGAAFLAAWKVGGGPLIADSMKTNTALCLALQGGAAVLLGRAGGTRRVGQGLALVGAAIAAATLLQYAAGIDLGLDELVAREASRLAEAAEHPNRMAPNAATNFLLLGVALALVVARETRLVLTGQICAVLALAVALLALVGYLYGAPPLYQPTQFIRISPYTAAGQVALAGAALARRADVGLPRLLLSPGPGGYMARRLLPMLIVVPLLLGAVRLAAERAGLVSTPAGTAILVITIVLFTSLLVAVLARELDSLDRRRRSIAHERQAAAELTGALSSAATVDEVAQVLVTDGARALGARAGSVLLLDAAGGALEMAGTHGYDPGVLRGFENIPLRRGLPVTDAVLDRAPIFLDSPDDAARRFPALRSASPVHRAWAALPLAGRDRVLGVLALSYQDPVVFDAARRERLTALASHCGQALDRALLLDSEQAARARAEAADRTKDEFLAMLGHELRNPLAPMLTAVELLKRRHPGAYAREGAIIDRHVRQMRQLVDDLLDVARITRGKIELRRVRLDVLQVVNRAIEQVSPLLEQRRHRLTVDVPEGLCVVGDEHRLTQVLSNLLTNAARYTDPGGHVEVFAREVEDHVRVSVRDDGAGIEPERMPHLFEPFAQAPARERGSSGGLGLGLALVRRLTELHGGVVRGASEGLGRGSTFTVELPLAPLKVVPGGGAVARGEELRPAGRRVLVVDDNRDAAEMLGEVLEEAGHEVTVAVDGPGAVDLAGRRSFDVAFVDLGMPAMDGFEVGARLLELQPRLELVALTGYGQASDRERTRAAGFAAHLVKPPDLELVLALAADGAAVTARPA